MAEKKLQFASCEFEKRKINSQTVGCVFAKRLMRSYSYHYLPMCS